MPNGPWCVPGQPLAAARRMGKIGMEGSSDVIGMEGSSDVLGAEEGGTDVLGHGPS